VRGAVAATLLSAADTERSGDAAAPQDMCTARIDHILITPYLRRRSGTAAAKNARVHRALALAV